MLKDRGYRVTTIHEWQELKSEMKTIYEGDTVFRRER